jgi:hypothetical protein
MTNPPNIDAIIAELSEVTGPSREMDAQIALANGYECPRTGNTLAQIMSWAPSNTIQEIARWSELPTTAFVLPRYTASLDAAMTLVPDRWEVESIGQVYGGSDRGKWTCGLYTRNPGLGPQSSTNDPSASSGRVATAALALCIAALRVRSALIGEVGRDG